MPSKPTRDVPAANGGRAEVTEKAAEREPKPSTPAAPILKPSTAFIIFFVVNVVAAIFSPIQDCDEVFNYWEPTHYLNHGYGLQTWEYSPEFAIRSWFYSGLHACIMALVTLLPVRKHLEFYFLRLVLALVCASCETQLFATIQKTLTPRVAIFFLMVTIASPGMFHASVAYLPSSFAMYSTMLGLAAFMDWQGGLRTAQGVMWFALGACVGWPFVGALALPFILEEILLALLSGTVGDAVDRILDGSMRAFVIVALQIAIDGFFYRHFTVVPWNMVKYNVFSGGSRGPDIYGTEPWHFYIRNLLINFNLWFILALLSFPVLLWQHFIRRKPTVLRGIVFLAPFYMWLVIFTLQPHKEERFMYPAYPALALNAAIALHMVLAYFGSTDPRDIVSRVPPGIKFGVVSFVILGALNLGILRTMNLVTGYAAPLQVYSPLRDPGVAFPGDYLCLGKEWYRFPSSYMLPDGVKAKFIRSEFNGLLPGEFSEAGTGSGFYPGSWMPPSGMNDQNIEDPGKYVDIARCKFLVDSRFQSASQSSLEPDYIGQTDIWEPLKCGKFLDNARTGLIDRLLYVPDAFPFVPKGLGRSYGQYCLLRRKTS